MIRISLLAGVLALSGCASTTDIAAYADQQCDRMKQHGGAEYDKCVVAVTQRCQGANARYEAMNDCHPSKTKM